MRVGSSRAKGWTTWIVLGIISLPSRAFRGTSLGQQSHGSGTAAPVDLVIEPKGLKSLVLGSDGDSLPGYSTCLGPIPLSSFWFLPFGLEMFTLCLSHHHTLEAQSLFHSVILWFILRNIYVVFIRVSGTEPLKSLELSVMRVTDVSCYVNEVTFGPHLRTEAGCQGNQPGVEG